MAGAAAGLAAGVALSGIGGNAFVLAPPLVFVPLQFVHFLKTR
jgi:hypothetical protein